MCVYRKLQQVMLSANLSPNILYELRIPRDEQLIGSLSSETLDNIQNKLLSSPEDHAIHSSMENFLCVQTVSDKTIADGVEALIGAYLKVRLMLPVLILYHRPCFMSVLQVTFHYQLFHAFCISSCVLASCFASLTIKSASYHWHHSAYH
jgi:hypothetical protein